MMEVEYKREMNRNYMVVEPNLGYNEKYAVRMLSGNKIPGLLPFHDKYVNGEMRYYYDITSKQPLDRILEHRTMSGQEIRTFIGDLVLVLKQMERFLLDEGQLCFDEKMIYIEPESFRVSFCLIPGKYGVFATEFCELAQYLLDHVSHNDGDAVVLAFSVFKESRKMNFGIEDIERCLQSKEPEKEIAIRPAKELEKDLEEDLPIEFNSFESLAKEGQEVGITLTKGRKIVSGIILSVMIAIPVIIFLAVGINGIMRWKWILMAVEILLTVTMIIIINTARFTAAFIEPEDGKHTYKDTDNEKEPWEVYFKEEENLEQLPKLNDDNSDDEIYDEEEFQTVLLNARPVYKECRKLVSVDGGEDISIPYFPFIIGKSKEITDYYLNEPGVSRLHVKFEEEKNGYLVTDLNSTNGTMVNGKLLEANETCRVSIGNEIVLASRKFRFQ